MSTSNQGNSLTEEATSTLLDAYKTIRKRWLWVVTFTGLAVVGTAFYTAGQVRIYRSSCVIQIDPKPPKPLGRDIQAVVDVGTNSYWANTSYYKTQFEIIRSRGVTEETVRRLGLHRNLAFLAGVNSGAPVPLSDGEDVAVPTVTQVASRVRGSLTVAPIKDSRLVTISYRDSDPARARQILSTLVSVYVDRNIDVVLDSTNEAADWLRTQVDKLKTELEDSEMALHEYRTDNRILSISLDDQSSMLRLEIQQLSAARTAVQVRQAQLSAQATELAKIGTGAEPDDVSATELLSDGALKMIRSSLVEAIAQRDALRGEGKAERHPLLASAQARVDAARVALAAEVSNLRRAAEREVAIVDHEVKSLSRLFEQAQERALQLGRMEIDYRRLERSKKNTEKLYSLVMERSKESDLTRMMRFNNIRTIDAPTVPLAPISPRVPMNMALGLAGGLLLGWFAAFAREMFDQSVKTPADVENDLGLTFLGLIPEFQPGEVSTPYGSKRRRGRRVVNAQANAELIVHDDPSCAASEAARSIRTSLSFMSPDKPHRSILVTSAGPSEGKTTIACCLATAMAQAGHRVVLVDADLRRPRVHRIFGHPNDRGVTSALLENMALSEVTRETQVPDLRVLLSGPACPNPAENLQSERFKKLLTQLCTEYDRVVIDSPPVGPVTDAVILSAQVDATVLVIRSMVSAREMVRNARRRIEAVRGNLVGGILNAVSTSRGGYPEYYRYHSKYYGPREGEDHESTEA